MMAPSLMPLPYRNAMPMAFLRKCFETPKKNGRKLPARGMEGKDTPRPRSASGTWHPKHRWTIIGRASSSAMLALPDSKELRGDQGMAYDDVLKAPRGIPGIHGTMVSVMNQKGGVGKSTTAINLSAALSEMGMKVLVIDLDPQGNATSGYGVDKDGLEHDMYDVIIDGMDAREIIVPTCEPRVFLAPATINLAGAEVQLVSKMAREMLVREALAPIRDDFDYIMVDCPPSLGLLTINALTASNGLVIPIQCEYYALEGVTKLLESMKMVKQALNRDLAISGILLTMYDPRTNLSRDVAGEVRKYFGKLTFGTVIPRSTSMAEAPSHGKPITLYAPSSIGAKAYRSVAQEVLARTTNGNVDLEKLVAEARARADAEAKERERERRLEIARRNFANLKGKAGSAAKGDRGSAKADAPSQGTELSDPASGGTDDADGGDTPHARCGVESDAATHGTERMAASEAPSTSGDDVDAATATSPDLDGAGDPEEGRAASSDFDGDSHSHDAAADLVADYATFSKGIDASMDADEDGLGSETNGNAGDASRDSRPQTHANAADRFADELAADLKGSMGEIDEAVGGKAPDVPSTEDVDRMSAAIMHATGHEDDADPENDNGSKQPESKKEDRVEDADEDFEVNADLVEDVDDFDM